MTAPRSLFAKLWERHVVHRHPSGQELLYIDRHYAHEGSFHAFAQLEERQLAVHRPDLTVAIADHYVPTQNRQRGIIDPEIRRMVDTLSTNAQRHGIRLYGLDDPQQGIVHVVGPELGLTLPGFTVVCGDSHTATHGALGALGFGIGASEVAHVLATQTLWQRRPRTLRVWVEGRLHPTLSAKDLILSLIAQIGADGGRGHIIEYAGSAIRALDMAGRLTVCNMSIEAGARAGIIAPDELTFAYLRERPYAPQGAAWDRALVQWSTLASDADAEFDREVRLDAEQIAPTVTWGTSPAEALPITGRVPPNADRHTLDYMALETGQTLQGLAVDRAFIGSCTNARLEDLRAAAQVLRGRRVRIPLLISPGSSSVKRAAEAEGLATIFHAAGADWQDSGCSLCVAMNGDRLNPGERCASTTNRNFRGRQGPGVRTHLMSPAMVAAAAVTGHLSDVRDLPSNGDSL